MNDKPEGGELKIAEGGEEVEFSHDSQGTPTVQLDKGKIRLETIRSPDSKIAGVSFWLASLNGSDKPTSIAECFPVLNITAGSKNKLLDLAGLLVQASEQIKEEDNG